MRASALVPLLLVLVAACAPQGSEHTEHTGRTSAPVIGGRPSGDDENANVYIETVGDGGLTLRCSGRILAPRLVISSRHCFLKRKTASLGCNPDGSAVDPSAEDLRSEPAERVTVFFGSEKPGLRPIAVSQVITAVEVSICRADLAFLVLAESPLDVRTPIRREHVKFGDSISFTGWGYTSDTRDALPLRRSTLVGLKINDVGPGRIPAGTFAIGGNSACLGDSGGVALLDGAAVGTYSRIDGDPNQCELEGGRNVFTEASAFDAFVKIAYGAIGEEPWYEGERPPWLAPSGAPCSRDDECRSNVCDRSAGKCAAPCGDAGLACPSGQSCSGDLCVAPDAGTDGASPAEPPAPASSCSAGGRRPASSSGLLVLLAASVGLVRRVRRARSPT